jgi:hypothetical protein
VEEEPVAAQPKIPSTSVIPPQQSHWIQNALKAENVPSANPFHKLPVELIDAVVRELGAADGEGLGATMTLAEAKQYRLELMDERTAFVKENDETCFSTEFNFCEH